MTEMQEILLKLEEINTKIDLLSSTAYMKVPEAAQYFRMGKAKLRELCDKGIIPASLMNEGTSKKHWIIPVAESREILKRGGYLHKMLQDRAPRKRNFN